jgi:hypothetical protein
MRIFGTISKMTKQDDGSLLVEGIASSESRDCQKEIITADAMKAALPEYMKFANVREMHQPKAAGVATECEVIDGQTMLKALIVDPTAIIKVESGTYKGFSIGGKVTSRDSVDKTIITGIELSEISLVDRPANPDAVFNMYKMDNVDDTDEVPLEEPTPEEDVTKKETPPPVGDPPPETPPSGEPPPEEQVVKIGDADVTLIKVDGKWVEKVADVVSKGCYSISQLANLAGELEYFAQSEAYDAAFEGDTSTIPAQARKLAGQLYDLLVQLVAEDVAEAKQRLKDAGKAADTDDLAKIVSTNAELAKAVIDKLTDERDTLQKSFDELKTKFDALPAPPKGVLISKITDNGEVEETEVPLPTDPVAAAKLLIKSAHSNGGFLIGPG